MARGDIEIRIDHLALDLAAMPGGAAARRALVEAALEKLGERLSRAPFRGRGPLGPAAIERLAVGGLTTDELLGPRGAERLADELYAELARRIG